MTQIFPEEIVEQRVLEHYLESGSRGIFGAPKSGKSALMSALFVDEQDTVILDTQNGYRDLGGRIWNLLEIAKEQKVTPLNALRLAFKQLKERPRRIIVLDTITDVEEWGKKEIIAGAFKNDSVGRSINEGKALGYGKGLDKATDLFMTIIKGFWALAPVTFSVGHMEYQQGTRAENYFRGIQLTLKHPKVHIPSLLDHIGMTSVTPDGRYKMSFQGFDVMVPNATGEGGQLQKVSGSRHKQLQGQEFILPEEDPWKNVREAYANDEAS